MSASPFQYQAIRREIVLRSIKSVADSCGICSQDRIAVIRILLREIDAAANQMT